MFSIQKLTSLFYLLRLKRKMILSSHQNYSRIRQLNELWNGCTYPAVIIYFFPRFQVKESTFVQLHKIEIPKRCKRNSVAHAAFQNRVMCIKIENSFSVINIFERKSRHMVKENFSH